MIEQQESSVPEKLRIGSLDGLRAIAIILVLMQHLTPDHNSNNGWRSLFFKVADIGWTGVDRFLVLSGFLITDILLKAKDKQRPLRDFFVRRLLRIVPAYYAALLIVFLVLPLFGIIPWKPFLAQLPYIAYVPNFFWATRMVWTEVQMAHFWSLGLEMQFYLVWPFLVYRLQPRSLLMWSAAALVIATVSRCIAIAAGLDADTTFVWTPLRWDGLIMGAVVAVLFNQGVDAKRLRGLAMVVATAGAAIAFYVLWYDLGYVFWKGSESTLNLICATLFPLIFSTFFAALLVLALQNGSLAYVLSTRVFKPIALYSYGLYIVHFLIHPGLVHLFGPAVLAQWLPGRDLPVYAYFVLASSVSLILAACSYHLFEVHFSPYIVTAEEGLLHLP